MPSRWGEAEEPGTAVLPRDSGGGGGRGGVGGGGSRSGGSDCDAVVVISGTTVVVVMVVEVLDDEALTRAVAASVVRSAAPTRSIANQAPKASVKSAESAAICFSAVLLLICQP